MPRFRPEGVVIPPERHDALRAAVSRHRRHPVGVKPRATDDIPPQHGSCRRLQSARLGRLLDRLDTAAGEDLPASGAHLIGQGERHAPEVDDARPRRVERAKASHVRLDLPDPLRPDLFQPLDSIRLSPPLQLGQARQLQLLEGDDELSARLVWDAVLGCEALQLRLPFPAEPGLERARPVIDAGVDDAGVVAALMEGQLRLLLQDREPDAGFAPEDLIGGGQPDDPPADDRQIVLAGHGRQVSATPIAGNRECRFPGTRCRRCPSGPDRFPG